MLLTRPLAWRDSRWLPWLISVTGSTTVGVNGRQPTPANPILSEKLSTSATPSPRWT